MNQDHFLNRYFTPFYIGVLLIGTLLAVIYANHQILTGDQTQMLDKGYLGAYQGIWQAFGNAASAVGNVPGSLSAVIVGGPLVLWDSPWAPMALLIALRLVSFLLFDAVIKRIFSQPVRLAFMVLYWLNPWLLYDSLMYNPSYLCFFTALHFWSAFKMRHQASFLYSFLHVVAIGGAMQLHYSWPVLAVMSMYLFYRRMIHISWVGAISGGLAIVASLIPYLQEYMANDSISRESDRYIGYGAVHVYPVLKAVLYWLRYGSTLFSNRIITDASFDWLTTVSWLQMVIQYCWQAVLFVVGAITVVVSAKLNWKYWKVIKPTIKRQHVIDDDTHWLLLFALATVIGIIVSAMLSPITFSYWHLILTYPLALIPLLVKAQSWQQKKPERFTQLLLGLAGFFLVINLVASHDSDKYSYKVNYADQVESRLIEIGLQPQQ